MYIFTYIYMYIAWQKPLCALNWHWLFLTGWQIPKLYRRGGKSFGDDDISVKISDIFPNYLGGLFRSQIALHFCFRKCTNLNFPKNCTDMFSPLEIRADFLSCRRTFWKEKKICAERNLTLMARSGSGAKAPPLATRPERNSLPKWQLRARCGGQSCRRSVQEFAHVLCRVSRIPCPWGHVCWICLFFNFSFCRGTGPILGGWYGTNRWGVTGLPRRGKRGGSGITVPVARSRV